MNLVIHKKIEHPTKIVMLCFLVVFFFSGLLMLLSPGHDFLGIFFIMGSAIGECIKSFMIYVYSMWRLHEDDGILEAGPETVHFTCKAAAPDWDEPHLQTTSCQENP